MKKIKCRNCGERFLCFNSLRPYCDKEECRDAMVSSVLLAKKKADAKAWQKEKVEIKERLKTLSDYEKEAKAVFQKWVRLRDDGLPCISCGNLNPKAWNGGHYFKAEIYSGLIFDERNCFRQCSRCNDLYSGMQAEYRIELVKRKGIEFVEQLEEDALRLRNYKYTKQELIDIKKKYSEKIKQLEVSK